MSLINATVGEQTRFSKTVSESDVYLFAGITGDLGGNHVDEEFMKTSKYGKRIAHGALIIGFMSTTSTLLIERCLAKGLESTPVSLGYDRIRMLKPVFLGDTVTVVYTVREIDEERLRTTAQIEVKNQHGDVVTVGEHIMKWVPRTSVDR
ncbi:MaoC/PaaZ C-terminal domain-containing protein [Aureimonas glaciei]|jgi:acyl dehydratase|uniref:MaoC family dehydratase n=1 Tax=Aureimonas glaciei TaxID=1776957 RepID=A0A916YEW3_9HYPH|nr:MaoC/PaaZ C-terminal domain-containing protein [Aureimonas glaciei]GGD42733.1 MaoC family dehydratase [Aureimonas glaciei]